MIVFSEQKRAPLQQKQNKTKKTQHIPALMEFIF